MTIDTDQAFALYQQEHFNPFLSERRFEFIKQLVNRECNKTQCTVRHALKKLKYRRMITVAEMRACVNTLKEGE